MEHQKIFDAVSSFIGDQGYSAEVVMSRYTAKEQKWSQWEIEVTIYDNQNSVNSVFVEGDESYDVAVDKMIAFLEREKSAGV